MRTNTISVLLMLCACFSVMAQSTSLETKLVLAQDDMRMKNYRAATRSLHWLMTNAPEHSKSIYIMAYKAYEKAAEKATDKAEKAMLLDSMMLSYRLKEKQFGLSALEKNNLAFRYYKYFKKDASKYPDAIKAYQEVYKSPESVINNNIVSYMSLIRAYQTKANAFDVKELMGLHTQVSKVIDMKRAAGVDATKLGKYTDAVDQIFLQTVKPVLNCEAIGDLSSEMSADNMDFTKIIFSWAFEFGCTDEDYFMASAKLMANDAEYATPGIIKIVAQREAANGNYDEAISWYEKSMPMWEDDMKRASIQMDMAKVFVLQGKKASARTAAFKAAELDAGEASRAYSFVANLYMGSFDDCAEEHSQVEDRTIFMAAYDLFEKAGDTAGMQSAQAQFPTVSQAHQETYEAGTMLDVGCWINVKTKLRTRKSN